MMSWIAAVGLGSLDAGGAEVLWAVACVPDAQPASATRSANPTGSLWQVFIR
jgi:hypothetical protein